jgi:Ser/Thr protein kinase RdoA (MazF antagonist)
MRPPPEVLSHLPPDLAAGEWEALGSGGGLSGAKLWRVRIWLDAWRLKAWPIGPGIGQQMALSHRMMTCAAEAGIDFIPRLLPGDPIVKHDEHLWEIVSWQSGTAPRLIDDAQLAAAGIAIARAHRIWEALEGHEDVCPGLARRAAALTRGVAFLRDHEFPPSDLADLAARTAMRLPAVLADTQSYREYPVPLQPCLCDLRAAHVLFENDQVTGIIDFGAARIDSPVTDLARYLGDTVGSDRRGWNVFLKAYEEIRPLTLHERQLIGVLHRSGIVAAAIYWLERIKCDTAFEMSDDVRQRLERLLHSLEELA